MERQPSVGKVISLSKQVSTRISTQLLTVKIIVIYPVKNELLGKCITQVSSSPDFVENT